jgi:uncharacterized protein YjbI with pentapeptide repeats
MPGGDPASGDFAPLADPGGQAGMDPPPPGPSGQAWGTVPQAPSGGFGPPVSGGTTPWGGTGATAFGAGAVPEQRRRRSAAAVVVPAVLVVAGAVVALVAVAQAASDVLVAAGALLVAGVVATAVFARRHVERPGRQVAIVGGAVVLAAAVLVPASLNVDPCTRIGREADLSGCDLAGEDLAGEDLRATDLTGADLNGANLAGAQLAAAKLDRANLRGANLADASLGDVTATEANLRGADLTGSDLDDADLSGADAQGAKASEAVLTGAKLADADLTGSDLTGADLAGADLSGADLTEAVLETAALAQADLTGTTLASGKLASADLAGADLTGADLTSADLTEVTAPGAAFDEAVLTQASLRSNDFVGTTGITDEGLAAALGVPAAQLPAETRLRGIVFDSYEDIVAAVTPVADGQAIPESRTYPASNAFHPTIVLDADGRASWLSDVTDQWAPTGIRFAELVVVVLPEAQRTIETCTGYVYDDGRAAPPINRYVRSVTVRVLSAHNARTIAEKTFSGSNPRACRTEEFLPTIAPSIAGGAPDLDGQAQPWLADVVNPPAAQPTS